MKFHIVQVGEDVNKICDLYGIEKETLEKLDTVVELSKKLKEANEQLAEALLKDTEGTFGLCTLVGDPQLYHYKCDGFVDTYINSVEILKEIADGDLHVRWDDSLSTSFGMTINNHNCNVIVNKNGGYRDEDNM